MRPDRPNRATRRLAGGAAGAAAVAAAVTLISACTTGTPGTRASTGGTTPLPSSPAPTTLPTATLPTDTGAPTGLPTDGTPSTSALPSSTAPSTPASSTPPKSTVTVFVTFHDWIAADRVAEVDSLVPNKVIANAVCTLRMTRGTLSRTATRKATVAPSSTSCGALTIPGSKLSPGDWTAVVTVTAPTATGSSDPVIITVTR